MRTLKLEELYRTTALLLLNTLVLVVLFNVFLAIVFFIKDHITGEKNPVAAEIASELESGRRFDNNGAPLNNGNRSAYQLRWFDYTAYERIVDEKYAGTVLDDFFQLSKLGFIYQPWVQFSEPPYKGKMVNIDVDSKGLPIRRTINPEKHEPSVIRIFTFGGSTTFGYGVSDEHTWPTYLSAILNKRAGSIGLSSQVEVMNYGRGFYDLSQEMVLLIDLLKAGHRPNLVVFLDGLNWGPQQDIPYLTDKFTQEFHNLQFASYHLGSILNDLNWVPMVRLANLLKRGLFRNGYIDKQNEQRISKKNEMSDQEYVRRLVNRFQENRKIIAQISKIYGTKALFFLQPDAMYNYPKDLYRQSWPDSVFKGRPLRQNFYNQMKTADGFIDLTGLFELWGHNRKAVVDQVHYSPAFNNFLAQHIAAYIDLASFVPRSWDSDDLESTGAPRNPQQQWHAKARP